MNEGDAKARAAEIRALSKPQKERLVADLSVDAMERTGARADLRGALRSLSDIFR